MDASWRDKWSGYLGMTEWNLQRKARRASTRNREYRIYCSLGQPLDCRN